MRPLPRSSMCARAARVHRGPGVVDQNVQPALLVDHLGDAAPAVIGRADVPAVQGDPTVGKGIGELGGELLYPAATSAPCEARLREMAAPIPRVPPVTNATRPSSFSPALPTDSLVAVMASPRSRLGLRSATPGAPRLPGRSGAAPRAGSATVKGRSARSAMFRMPRPAAIPDARAASPTLPDARRSLESATQCACRRVDRSRS
jgi:hypothetical protein